MLIGRLKKPVCLRGLGEAEVADERQVVRRVVVGGQAVGADLLLARQLEHGVDLEAPVRVPDVVQRVAALAAGAPDLPAGVGRLGASVRAQPLVGAVQPQWRWGKALVHVLPWLGVEVAADNQRHAGLVRHAFLLHHQAIADSAPVRLASPGDCIPGVRFHRDVAQALKQAPALRATEALPAAARFQVRHSHAEPPARLPATQRGNHGNLVGLEHHGRQPQVAGGQHLEAVAPEEESAAVGPVVVHHVQARRPGLGAKAALVAQAGEHGLEGVVVVVHLLQAQDVGLVGEDLLQDQVLPLGPVQSLRGAAHKAILPLTQRWSTTQIQSD